MLSTSAKPTHSVLIVEDEAIVALGLKLQLQELGCEVADIAESGETAIEKVWRRVPDIILTF